MEFMQIGVMPPICKICTGDRQALLLFNIWWWYWNNNNSISILAAIMIMITGTTHSFYFHLIVFSWLHHWLRSTFLQRSTTVRRGHLTRCRPSFATVFFLFSLNRSQLFSRLIVFSWHHHWYTLILCTINLLAEFHSGLPRTPYKVPTELCHRIRYVFTPCFPP